ncbi:SWR1-complex protein 3 [Ranunculus cassubicifolius]
MANWCDILDDIVDLFVQKLPPVVEEFARFGSVCKSWRASACNRKQQHCVQFAPWLMLAKKDDDEKICDDNEEGIRSFYSISSKRIFNLKLPTKGRRCWGTSYGWVVTMGLDLNINLLNPLSGRQISLPSQLMFEHQYRCHVEPQYMCRNFIRKFAIASNSFDDQCPTVMAIHGEFRTLAFATPGDKSWTSLEGRLAENIKEVIYFKDHFYAVDNHGRLRVCEMSATPPTTKEIASPPNCVSPTNTFYLVEIFGDLHLVARVFYEEDEDIDEAQSKVGDTSNMFSFLYVTNYFLVFKFDFHTRKWAEVEDLGEHALFVGNNASFCISTSNYSEFKGNCIYFTDDNKDAYEYGYCDMGVYDIKEDSVKPIYADEDKLSQFSRPLFFIPTCP